MDDLDATIALRQKYTHFRILVIGRANAGKTTLLKRVCNTTEEPCIYDERNNDLVRLIYSGRIAGSNALRSTSLSLPRR